MILVPKAIKGWNVSWGTGFSRVFYVAAFVLSVIFAVAISDGFEEPAVVKTLVAFAVAFLASIVAIKVIGWVFGGFIKKK